MKNPKWVTKALANGKTIELPTVLVPDLKFKGCTLTFKHFHLDAGVIRAVKGNGKASQAASELVDAMFTAACKVGQVTSLRVTRFCKDDEGEFIGTNYVARLHRPGSEPTEQEEFWHALARGLLVARRAEQAKAAGLTVTFAAAK